MEMTNEHLDEFAKAMRSIKPKEITVYKNSDGKYILSGEKENNMITEDQLKKQCMKIGNKIKEDIPNGCGFTLLLFGYSPNQLMTYMSTAQREDMIKVLDEFRNILIRDASRPPQ